MNFDYRYRIHVDLSFTRGELIDRCCVLIHAVASLGCFAYGSWWNGTLLALTCGLSIWLTRPGRRRLVFRNELVTRQGQDDEWDDPCPGCTMMICGACGRPK